MTTTLKRCFSFILFIGILAYSSDLSAQTQSNTASTQDKFVQFIVPGLQGWEEARNIDDMMRTKSSIVVSRTDFNTKMYFAIFSDQNVNETTLKNWFSEMGYTEISCYREGIKGIDKVVILSNDCTQNQ
jgi:hypothetical protein